MTCALKVDTNTKKWSETTTKILEKIKGVNYNFDTNEGMIYISGKANPRKILNRIAKHQKKVELCWVRTGEQYSYGNNMSAYPTTYPSGYYPPPPGSYYQSYDPYFAPHQTHGYPPFSNYYM